VSVDKSQPLDFNVESTWALVKILLPFGHESLSKVSAFDFK